MLHVLSALCFGDNVGAGVVGGAKKKHTHTHTHEKTRKIKAGFYKLIKRKNFSDPTVVIKRDRNLSD